MRLYSVAASAALSAVLLSGCSFITGKPGKYENPYAKQKAAHHGQYGSQNVANRCQVFSPRQPVPQGCRPEQVTLATAPQGQYGAGQYRSTNGFPQQPQYGQPQYADGSYGTAVGQAHGSTPHYQTGPKLKKPKLRGSLSLGVEKSVSGALLDYAVRDDLDPRNGYNPQIYNEGRVTGSQAAGSITQTTFTANELDAANIFAPNTFESSTRPTVSFDDVWSTPASLKAGLEYVAGKNTTVFVNGGYTHAEGNSGNGATVTATLYQEDITQNYTPVLDADGAAIPGAFVPSGGPIRNVSFIPNQEIARFTYDFSDLRQYDVEVGARHYLKPFVQSEGYRTVTPFIGGAVGASHVSAVDVTVGQSQAFYQRTFEESGDAEHFYSVPTPTNSTRLYDSQWIPQGQLNVGAEWQLTPGFALAAETGVRVQGAREYADFTNAAGETISGEKGDANISIPFTLRGSVNF